MMVTGEACKAIFVVLPLWIFPMTALDVSYWAYIGTDAASYTALFFYMKWFVGDKYMLKETANDLGEEPRYGPFYESAAPFFPV